MFSILRLTNCSCLLSALYPKQMTIDIWFCIMIQFIGIFVIYWNAQLEIICCSFAFSGSFDGHLSLWNIGEQEPKLQHTIKCCEKAISTIFVLTDTLPGFLAIGSEDGLVHYVNMFISIENRPRLKSVSTQPQVKLWLWCSHQ